MASPIIRTTTGVARSDWARLNYHGGINEFNATVVVTPESSNTATWTVEATISQFEPQYHVYWTRAATTATVTYSRHGLRAADSVVLVCGRESNLTGTFQVATVPDDDTFTITVTDTGATSGRAQAAFLKVFDLTDLTAVTGEGFGQVFAPVTGIRLNTTASTGGKKNYMEVVEANR